jgi:hypothetical protein
MLIFQQVGRECMLIFHQVGQECMECLSILSTDCGVFQWANAECFLRQVSNEQAMVALCGGKDALTGVPVYLHHCRPR